MGNFENKRREHAIPHSTSNSYIIILMLKLSFDFGVVCMNWQHDLLVVWNLAVFLA